MPLAHVTDTVAVRNSYCLLAWYVRHSVQPPLINVDLRAIDYGTVRNLTGSVRCQPI